MGSVSTEERGDGRATRKKDPGATERVLRRGIRCPYNCPGFGTAASRAPYLQGAPVTLADMAQLCGELSVHRNCLGKSPPSHALCHRRHTASDVVQFRASVFCVAASALHRMDGRERIGTAACCLLCRGLFPRERDLYSFDSRAYRASPSQRSLAEGAQDHALPVDSHFMCFRGGCGRCVEISAGWARNVYLLPDSLSEA